MGYQPAIELARIYGTDVAKWGGNPAGLAAHWGISHEEAKGVEDVLRAEGFLQDHVTARTYISGDGYVGTKEQTAGHELGRQLAALSPDSAWVPARGGDIHAMDAANQAGEMFRASGAGVLPGAREGDLTRDVGLAPYGSAEREAERIGRADQTEHREVSHVEAPAPPIGKTAIYDEGTRSWRVPPPGNYEAKATYGEQTAAFRGFTTPQGWFLLDGPSGNSGHAYNAPGFDLVAVRLDGPFQLRLVDNKALNADTVYSATAITKHLDANLADLQTRLAGLHPADMPRLAEIQHTIAQARAALAAKQPLPAEIVLEITHEGGLSSQISKTLKAAGLVTRPDLDRPDPYLPKPPASVTAPDGPTKSHAAQLADKRTPPPDQQTTRSDGPNAHKPPAEKPPTDQPQNAEKPPADKPTAPSDKPTAPSDKPTAPSDKPTAPSDKPTAPSDKPTAPSDKPTAPSDKPTAPSDKPTAPSDKPTAPSDRPDGGSLPGGTGTGEGSTAISFDSGKSPDVSSTAAWAFDSSSAAPPVAAAALAFDSSSAAHVGDAAALAFDSSSAAHDSDAAALAFDSSSAAHDSDAAALAFDSSSAAHDSDAAYGAGDSSSAAHDSDAAYGAGDSSSASSAGGSAGGAADSSSASSAGDSAGGAGDSSSASSAGDSAGGAGDSSSAAP